MLKFAHVINLGELLRISYGLENIGQLNCCLRPRYGCGLKSSGRGVLKPHCVEKLHYMIA